MSIQKVDNLLDEGQRRFTPLQRLLKTAANQKQWTAEFRAVLDADGSLEDGLKHQVEVIDVRGSECQIRVRNAALATRLRFALPELQSSLTALQSFSRVTEFKIRVY